MQKLSGKVAVITGGNSGIGLACAQAFAAEGARVAIVGRRQDAVEPALAGIGPDAMGFVGDVADLAMHDRLLTAVKARFGAIDIYVANAGTAILEPSSAVTVDNYDAQFATNTRAVFFGVTKALALMRDGGSIILTSSIAGSKVMDNHAVYAGSKAAIEAFARNWALELKHRRIRVNVLSPGRSTRRSSRSWASRSPSGLILTRAWLRRSRWVAWASRMIWRKRRCTWRATTACSSRA
jgi:NAD(P)-dependent dehydrogenase (short-subunit alcohol dehydrogenase family)